MKSFRKFGAALTLSALVATGTIASSARLEASSFDGTVTKTSICQLLAYAYSSVSALPDSSYKTYLLHAIASKQASLGCQ